MNCDLRDFLLDILVIDTVLRETWFLLYSRLKKCCEYKCSRSSQFPCSAAYFRCDTKNNFSVKSRNLNSAAKYVSSLSQNEVIRMILKACNSLFSVVV